MKKQLIAHLVGYALFFLSINSFWAYKEKLPFFDSDILWFSVPVTVFGFLYSMGVVTYKKYRKR